MDAKTSSQRKTPSRIYVPYAPRVHHYLTSEDYENIYLRVKEKVWKGVLGLMAFAATIGGLVGAIGGYELAKRQFDSAISAYTNTDEFRASMISYAQRNLPDMHAELGVLEERASALQHVLLERRELLEAMLQAPLAVSGHGYRLTAADGNSLRLEFGSQRIGGRAGTWVQFKEPFRDPPIILTSFPSGWQESRFERSNGVSEVSATGFNVHHSGFGTDINWVAIGR